MTVLCISAWSAESAEKCSQKDMEEKLFDEKHTECIAKYLNHTLLLEEFNLAVAEDSIPQFMKTNCPKWRSSLECVDTYLEEVNPCLSFFQQMTFKVARKLIETAISHVCSHNGTKLIKFATEGGLECLMDTQDTLKECTAGIINDDLISAVNMEEGGVPKFNLSTNMFTGNECRTIYNASQCMINLITNECTQSSSDFVKELFVNLYKQTPCFGLMGMMDIQWEHFLFSLMLPKHIPTKDRICNDSRTALDVNQEQLKKGSICWNKVVDNDFLMSDLQHAFETKTLYSFLKKYCPKLHGTAACIGNYMDSFGQCVTGDDLKTLNATKYIVKGVADFVCHRDGERVLLFLKENGFECFEQQRENIRSCIDSTGANKLFESVEKEVEFHDFNSNPASVLSRIWVPQNYTPAECKLLVSVEVCVYKMMRQCKQTSPANLISSLVRSVAKRSPCWDIELYSNDANNIRHPTALIFAAFIIMLFTYLQKLCV